MNDSARTEGQCKRGHCGGETARLTMPIYEYGCPNGHVFEVLKKLVDPIEQECEVCGAPCHRRPSLFNQSKKAGIYVFDRRYGGRDILHDPSISERERQDAISTIAAGMQEHREAMPP